MRKVNVIKQTKPVMPRKPKVAAYARVSMDSRKPAHSLSTQVGYYNNLIRNNPEWEFAGIFADYGISGTSIKRRNGFCEMIAACENGDIDIILTKSISRFARNTVDLLNTVRRLKDMGIEVRFEKENISSFSTDGELLLSLLAAFAEEESRTQSNNVKWAIKRNFEKGIPQRNPAFGYKWNGENFVIDASESLAVRKIYDDFLNDIPLAETSRWLKENGFRATTKTFIKYALQNIIYTGDLLMQRYYTSDTALRKTVKNNGELPMYLVEKNHEAIIDRTVFDKVQEKIQYNLDFNKEAHRIVKPKCFSSKIKCSCCGNNYVSIYTRKKDGKPIWSWACYGKIKRKVCAGKNISEKDLKAVCCAVMGMPEFDEELFARTVQNITVHTAGNLIFRYYDGRTATGKIQFYSDTERKYKDPHTKIYGYKWTDCGYEVLESEAKAVRMVYDDYISGMTISDISRKMENLGYKSTRGKFTRKMVLYILSNRFYTGERFFPKNYSGTGKDETVLNDHEPIIDMDKFEAAKTRREKYAERHNNTRNNKQKNIVTHNG